MRYFEYSKDVELLNPSRLRSQTRHWFVFFWNEGESPKIESEPCPHISVPIQVFDRWARHCNTTATNRHVTHSNTSYFNLEPWDWILFSWECSYWLWSPHGSSSLPQPVSAIGEDEHAHRGRQHGPLHLHPDGPHPHGPGDQTGVWWGTKWEPGSPTRPCSCCQSGSVTYWKMANCPIEALWIPLISLWVWFTHLMKLGFRKKWKNHVQTVLLSDGIWAVVWTALEHKLIWINVAFGDARTTRPERRYTAH